MTPVASLLEHFMRVSSRSSSCVILCGLSLLGAAACGSTANGGTVRPDSGTEDAPPAIVFPLMLDAGHDVHAQVPDASLTHDTGVDARPDVPAPPTDAELNTYPSFKPVAPQVINAAGGHVLSAPIFVPIIFAGDQYETQIEAYVAAIGQSQYWATAVGEYGVGAGTSATPIIMDETMPSTIDDSQLQIWLSNRIGTDPRFGALQGTSLFDAGAFDAGSIDATAPLSSAASASNATPPPNVVYAIFMPDGASVTEGDGTSCTDFGGYHNSYFAPNGSDVVYAVVPRCDGFGGLNGFDDVSGASSHELAEAATDPLVGGSGDRSAFSQVDLNHIFWESVLGGGEVGDMCAQFQSAFYHPTEALMSSYVVQRIWSNASAAAGHDPCVPVETPAQGEPYYFNSVPNFGSVQVNEFGQDISTIGGVAPPGVLTTIELDLFSDAPTNGEGWQVHAVDANEFMGGAADLDFSPAVTGVNGDKLLMTVTNVNNAGNAPHPFVLISTQGQLQNWWIGVLTN
jgi:hypothetical protein